MPGYTGKVIVTASNEFGQAVQDFNVKVYDSPMTTLALDVSPSEITEGNTTIVTVTASTGLYFGRAQTVTVSNVVTGDVNAVVSPSVLRITIEAGELSNSGTISVNAIDNDTYSENGTLTLNGTSIGHMHPGSTTATLVNDDAPPESEYFQCHGD